MPRPKDAKIWNEDLIAALEARHQQSLRHGKRDAHTWRTGRDKIQAQRKDIYQFRTGTIANLPTGMTKKVQRLCEDIIRGLTNVYPDGHVPTHGSSPSVTMGREGTPAFGSPAAPKPKIPTSSSSSDNPFRNDHYMTTMKIRGGAYAILMAFHHSHTDVLRKSQICSEAQKFCDDQMDSNYMAGRTYGAWKSIDTLKSHHLVTEQGFRTYSSGRTGGGFRDRPHEYSLTRDGRMFVEALLAKRPEAAAAARQAAGGVAPSTSFAGTRSAVATMSFSEEAAWEEYDRVHGSSHPNNAGTIMQRRQQPPSNDPFFGSPPRGTLGYSLPPSAARIGSSATPSSNRNISADKAELEQWVARSEVGNRYDFKVGKDRRKHLHRLCDTLQENYPGLLLTHSSLGTGRGRVLSIQMVAKPMPASASSIGRKRPLPHDSPSDFPGYSQMTARTPTPASKRSRALTPAQNAAAAAMRRLECAKEEASVRRVIGKSAKLASRQQHILDDEILEIDGDDDNEKMLQRAIRESLQESSTKKTTEACYATDDCRKKAALTATVDILSSDSESDGDNLLKPVFSLGNVRCSGGMRAGRNKARNGKRAIRGSSPKVARKIAYTKGGSNADPIEIVGSQKWAKQNVIDLLDNDPDVLDSNDTEDDDVIIIDSDQNTAYNDIDELVVLVDNRERNRNATPRALRIELARHLSSGGPISAVWPLNMPSAKVEEVALDHGDFGFDMIHPGSRERHRIGVSVERKRVNDLVQRSHDGDHLSQLFRMQQKCSLSVLLIEYDTRMASRVTPYNAQHRDGFDPFDTTITCEDDVFLMLGRVILSSDKIKFIQSKDEQSSLRAVGALGLMSLVAPEENTMELASKSSNEGVGKNLGGSQALCDILKNGGIPWRLAQRIASVIGGSEQLRLLYKSCSNEEAKSRVLSPLMLVNNGVDLGGLRSTAEGWSNAVYRIIEASYHSSSTQITTFTGEGALLMHKDLMEDHGIYLSHFHSGLSPDEALDQVLNSSNSISTRQSCTLSQQRYVSIRLTENQSARYFPDGDDGAFYKLSITSSNEVGRLSSAIVMRTENKSFVSTELHIFVLEGSALIDIIEEVWKNHQGSDFLMLAPLISMSIDAQCKCQTPQVTGARNRRVVLICGLQPALDSYAKKEGYRTETKTVLDLVLADVMLRYDITIMQALRKKMEDRINVVRQLALACFHFGLTTCSI